MTEAMRDAIREVINRDEWEDDDLDALSDAIIEALEPHFAAREAAAVASAVLAEREACARVAELGDGVNLRQIASRSVLTALQQTAAAIRARSTQESGR